MVSFPVFLGLSVFSLGSIVSVSVALSGLGRFT